MTSVGIWRPARDKDSITVTFQQSSWFFTEETVWHILQRLMSLWWVRGLKEQEIGKICLRLNLCRKTSGCFLNPRNIHLSTLQILLDVTHLIPTISLSLWMSSSCEKLGPGQSNRAMGGPGKLILGSCNITISDPFCSKLFCSTTAIRERYVEDCYADDTINSARNCLLGTKSSCTPRDDTIRKKIGKMGAKVAPAL